MKVFFTFSQGERIEFYLAGQSVMKSTVVLDDVLYHPRCSRTAGNQYDVVSGRCPSIPKMLQCLDEVGTRSIHPG